MKICIAQTKAVRGNVQENILNHLDKIERAIAHRADLIIFPELSITGYEPELAKSLATCVENKLFDPFQNLSHQHQIYIGVGMPTLVSGGIAISLLIFQPQTNRTVYSKQILHEDELPYFVTGTQQVFLNIKNEKIALGICYETLQREHFLKAMEVNATIYCASLSKPKNGLEKALDYFPKIAKEFNTPVLISNAIGFCDNFVSTGKSSIWNKSGKLIGQLDSESEV